MPAFRTPIRTISIVLVVLTGFSTLKAHAQPSSVDLGGQMSVSPKAFARQIERDLEELRGLPFKKEIEVQNQSKEDFIGYIDTQLAEQVPPEKLANLSEIVSVVGLYRGPAFDYEETVKLLMGSQAAAYYEPTQSTFFVVKSTLPEVMMGGLYAHELYHGLQDQYFDLRAYYGWDGSGYAPNDDELLARQSVVEGEAMYVMQLWVLQEMLGGPPDPGMLQMTMQQMSGVLDSGSLRSFIRSNAASSMLGDPKEVLETLDALDKVPQFMVVTLVGAYIRGMIFVADVHRGGWPAVERLFSNPPASSEMILHPEKWHQNEVPFTIEFPELEEQPALSGWKVLDENTLGEVQIGIVFSEYDFPDIGRIAAAGWDGDRYAVLRHETSGENLLLFRSAWDSVAEAEEFAGAYLEIAKIKDGETGRVTHIEQDGTDVLIVEAPPSIDAAPLFEVIRSSTLTKPENS